MKAITGTIVHTTKVFRPRAKRTTQAPTAESIAAQRSRLASASEKGGKMVQRASRRRRTPIFVIGLLMTGTAIVFPRPATAASPVPTQATIVATNLVLGPSSTGDAEAVCPGNNRVVGGGVVQSGSAANLFVKASGPLDATGVTANTNTGDVAKRWYAAVRNTNSGQVAIKVFALCSNRSDATIVATRMNIAQQATVEGFAVCPSGKRALGGGFVQSGPPGDFFLDASGPLDATGVTANTVTGDVAKQWYVAVTADDSSTAGKVFAICTAKSNATIQATALTVNPTPSGTSRGAFAKCAGAKRALGGGVVQSGTPRLFVGASGPLDASGVTVNTTTGDVAKQWYADIHQVDTVPRKLKVFAICE